MDNSHLIHQSKKIHSVSRDDILTGYSEEVFRLFFRSDFSTGKYYSSPLRSGDSSPSFNIFESSSNPNILIYKDWGGSTGNCIDFVVRKENCTFTEALERINEAIKGKIPKSQPNSKQFKDSNGDNILFFPYMNDGKVSYTDTDTWYWEVLHKTPLSIVKKNRIFSIKEIRINGNSFLHADTKNPIYCYLEVVDGVNYYKFYAPFRKDRKWLSNLGGVATKAIGGLHLLPAYGEELIITKSVKDRTILYGMGFNVVSTQGEDIGIDEEILNDLKARFKVIFLLYDNDYGKTVNTGKILGDKYQQLWGVGRILIPEEIPATDIGELIQRTDKDTLKKLINKWKI